MTETSVQIQIEEELKSYLKQLSYEELQKTTKKKCKIYLEQKLNTSLSKQKNHIKLCLSKFITNYLNSNNKIQNNEKKDNETKNNEIKNNDATNQKLNDSMDVDAAQNNAECKETEIINDIDRKNKVKSSVVMISPLSPFQIESNQNIKQMTSLIHAENLMYSLNEQLTKSKKGKIHSENVNYDNIEHEALKNKLTKCKQECLKYKELTKKYAALLQPKVILCQNLKKENEILTKNIVVLNNNHIKEIEKLKNCLQNESENVKEERFKCLRKDKYIQRLENKFIFICNKYDIDKDSVVVEMNE